MMIRSRLALALGGVLAVLAGSRAATAGPLLLTFGADGFGAPTGLNQMDASSSSVTNIVTPLGDGNTGYNGGVVYAGGLLYAVGNDSSGVANIYSFTTSGQNLTLVTSGFNTAGDGAAFVFQNGLAAIGGSLYAIGAGPSGEDLFQIGAGTATLVRPLMTFNGTYAGLAYDPGLGVFYGVIANATGDLSGDLLVKLGLSGGTSVVANLTSIDGAEPGTHLGGVADTGGGILYAIYTNVNDGNGELERISLNGTPSASTLYDTNIPLAQNAGLAVIPVSSVPEPPLGIAVLLMSALFILKARRRPETTA